LCQPRNSLQAGSSVWVSHSSTGFWLFVLARERVYERRGGYWAGSSRLTCVSRAFAPSAPGPNTKACSQANQEIDKVTGMFAANVRLCIGRKKPPGKRRNQNTVRGGRSTSTFIKSAETIYSYHANFNTRSRKPVHRLKLSKVPKLLRVISW